jgi:N-acetylmuramoyl-L-alanine amidase-like protein
VNLPGALRAEGLVINEIRGWETRGRPGTFAPVGALWHHTAGAKSLGIIVNGRSDLPGPLANLHVEKPGHVNLVSANRCNHAGKGAGEVVKRLRAGQPPRGDAGKLGLPDDTDGNGILVGIEVENLGDGRDPYPDPQLDTVARVGAALSRFYGFGSHAHAHHREWTRRKIDMSWRGPLRDAIADRLKGGIVQVPTEMGYFLAGADGGVFNLGKAPFLGSAGGVKLAAPIVNIESTASGGGYWLVAADGGVFAYGDARFFGAPVGKLGAGDAVRELIRTQTGLGYWVVSERGGIFSYGDAQFAGSVADLKLAAPIVGGALWVPAS